MWFRKVNGLSSIFSSTKNCTDEHLWNRLPRSGILTPFFTWSSVRSIVWQASTTSHSEKSKSGMFGKHLTRLGGAMSSSSKSPAGTPSAWNDTWVNVYRSFKTILNIIWWSTSLIRNCEGTWIGASMLPREGPHLIFRATELSRLIAPGVAARSISVWVVVDFCWSCFLAWWSRIFWVFAASLFTDAILPNKKGGQLCSSQGLPPIIAGYLFAFDLQNSNK